MTDRLIQNIPEKLWDRVQRSPLKTAYLSKHHGAWQSTSWEVFFDQVYRVAKIIQRYDLPKGARVAIVSQTRHEWVLVDHAILSCGLVSVPIYPSLAPDDVHFILKDAKCQLVVVENQLQSQKIQNIRSQLPELREILSIEESPSDDVVSLAPAWEADSLLGLGPLQNRPEVKTWMAKWSEIGENELASVVYTSGTAGVPKGACLTHKNFLSMMKGVTMALDLTDQDISLLFLPLAHIMGRIEHMVSLESGMVNAFVENLDRLMDNLGDIRPTIFLSVPRIFEKIYSGIQQRMAHQGVAQKKLSDAVVGAARMESLTLQKGWRVPWVLKSLNRLSEPLFRSKIQSRFGGRLRFAVSGGAPLSTAIAEFFHSAGILILEGYGLTETTGPICVNRPRRYKFGTVGQVLEGSECRLGDDGEILFRGSLLARGYTDSSLEFLNPQGWYGTGDVGELDADGFLKITDRKKEMIVLSGGKNIAPLHVESFFQGDPLFAHVLVVGDGRSRLGALVTLNLKEARRQHDAVVDLAEDPILRDIVRKKILAINEQLAPFEHVRHFAILGRDFSVETGELTPSLKIRRKFCEQKYKNQIEDLYGKGSL